MFKETKFTQFPVFSSKRLFSSGREVYIDKPSWDKSIIKKQREKADKQKGKEAKKVAELKGARESIPGLRETAKKQAGEVLKAQSKLKPLADRMKKLKEQKQNISIELVKDFIRAEASLKLVMRKLLDTLSKIRRALVKLKKFKEANLVKIKAVLEKARRKAKEKAAKKRLVKGKEVKKKAKGKEVEKRLAKEKAKKKT
jgi:hypothetical protein